MRPSCLKNGNEGPNNDRYKPIKEYLFPQSGSFKEIQHFTQLYRGPKGKFRAFNYGTKTNLVR